MPHYRNDINFILDRLYKFNKDLGGAEYKEDKRENVFFGYFTDFNAVFKEVRALQDKRDAFNYTAIKVKKVDIIDIHRKIEDGLRSLEEYLNRMKMCFEIFKNSKKNFEKAEEAYSKCENYLRTIRKKEKIYARNAKRDQNLDLQFEKTGMTQAIVDQDFEFSTQEEELLEKWEDEMSKMNDDLKEIYSQLSDVLDRLDRVDEEMGKNDELIRDLGTKMESMNEDVESVNEKLKQVVEKMRAPNKLCMDISLSFILAMLIGTLVWVIRMYSALGENPN